MNLEGEECKEMVAGMETRRMFFLRKEGWSTLRHPVMSAGMGRTSDRKSVGILV